MKIYHNINMKYDKPRIASTIIIGIFLTASMFFTILFYGVFWSSINVSTESGSEAEASVVGQIVAAGAAAFAIGFLIILIILLYAIIVAANGVLFLFSFKNRNSTLKPVRIISYVMDGLIVATSLAAVIKLILFIVGV